MTPSRNLYSNEITLHLQEARLGPFQQAKFDHLICYVPVIDTSRRTGEEITGFFRFAYLSIPKGMRYGEQTALTQDVSILLAIPFTESASRSNSVGDGNVHDDFCQSVPAENDCKDDLYITGGSFQCYYPLLNVFSGKEDLAFFTLPDVASVKLNHRTPVKELIVEGLSFMPVLFPGFSTGWYVFPTGTDCVPDQRSLEISTNDSAYAVFADCWGTWLVFSREIVVENNGILENNTASIRAILQDTGLASDKDPSAD